jgi:hypothetical protein
MTWNNYPDIEIYLRTNQLQSILNWLSHCFESTSAPQKAGNTFKLTGHFQNYIIPITITQCAAGKHYTSVTFDSNNTPWATDLVCARAAFAHTGVEVRCSAGSWEDNASKSDNEAWWKIDNEGEFRVCWDD